MQMDVRSLDQLLPPDHRARLVWAYVDGLDLSPFFQQIKAVQGRPGQPAIDPRILLSLWLLATIEGVGSARELDRLCEQHMAYQWLCGGVGVNYHTLSDFRSDHRAAFGELLTQSVATLLHQKLVDLHEVAQDGMRVRASAGTKSFRRKPTLEQCLEKARQQVETLKNQADEDEGAVSRRQQAARARAAREQQERVEAALREQKELAERRQRRVELKGKKVREARASTTDAEARTMKMPDGGFRPGFNVELATDTGSGIIVGVDVTNLGSDNGQIRPMIDQIETRYQTTPRRLLVDGDFANLDDIEHLGTVKKIEVYAPVKDGAKQQNQGRNPYQPKTTDPPNVGAWRTRMGTDEGKKIYTRRASTAEWANARLRNMGLRQFLVRGLEKVKAVATLFAIASNCLQSMRLRAAATTG